MTALLPKKSVHDVAAPAGEKQLAGAICGAKLNMIFESCALVRMRSARYGLKRITDRLIGGGIVDFKNFVRAAAVDEVDFGFGADLGRGRRRSRAGGA